MRYAVLIPWVFCLAWFFLGLYAMQDVELAAAGTFLWVVVAAHVTWKFRQRSSQATPAFQDREAEGSHRPDLSANLNRAPD